MAVAHSVPHSDSFVAGIDEMLIDVCEDLQLSPSRYDLAVQRYNALNRRLESAHSPFRLFRPEIYPQGSMALGTTVKPVMGPHDLDFVLQLSRDHKTVDPMALIHTLYTFLRGHEAYGPVVSLKNRCVRIEYADDFYMDVLPACHDLAAGGSCIMVPDRAIQGWSRSNPMGYIAWFEKRGRVLLVERILERATLVPAQQAVSEKNTLQLIVQLIKRWRDMYYVGKYSELAPISIILTTLAAHCFTGQQSVSQALMTVLNGAVVLIDKSRQGGEKHLRLANPSNLAEDLTERWDEDHGAYIAFEKGIRVFRETWSRLIVGKQDVNSELEKLFGEPVKAVLKKRAQRLQEDRAVGKLGVTPSGMISSIDPSSVIPARRNTFYGTE